ncbi:MAG: (5-formylfuran-3-yl)methyl phosphate synthase [Burkholderiales bacterium]
MTHLLASVTSIAEAKLVMELGADIIDLKDPRRGALGALPIGVIRDIVRAVAGQRPVSATIGDVPLDAELIRAKLHDTTKTGVDIVKIGFATSQSQRACAETLAVEALSMSLVAVLFADQPIEIDFLATLARCGYYGVMLDTADKNSGSLLRHLSVDRLGQFVAHAQRLKLLCGLAGSLRETDIATLLALKPDYLGFRGALCTQAMRTMEIDPAAMKRIRALIPRDADQLSASTRETRSHSSLATTSI